MAVLGAVVEPLVGAVLEAGRDLPLRGAVRGQPVGHDPPRPPALLLEKPDEQAARGALVAAALHDLVEHDPVLVDGPPEPADPAADHDPDLVEVPDVARPRRPAPQLPREGRAELHPPPAHRLVGDVDPALEQHLLDHSQAEREAGVEPHDVGDDLAREAMAAVQGADRHEAQRLRARGHHGNRQPLNVTSPADLLRQRVLQAA